MQMDCMHSDVVQFISWVLQLSNVLDVNLSYGLNVTAMIAV